MLFLLMPLSTRSKMLCSNLYNQYNPHQQSFLWLHITGCSINLSAKRSMKAISEEVLAGLSVDDIFDD